MMIILVTIVLFTCFTFTSANVCPNGKDITGWKCNSDTSTYCNCHTESIPYSCTKYRTESQPYSCTKRQSVPYSCYGYDWWCECNRWKTCYRTDYYQTTCYRNIQVGYQSTCHRNEWFCEVADTEECVFGTPACQYGQCKEASLSCGNEWDSSMISGYHCDDFFVSGTSEFEKCDRILGNQAICPISFSVIPTDYTTWADVQSSEAKTKEKNYLALLDLMWWWDKYTSMILTNEDIELDIDLLPQLMDYIGEAFETYRKFSCYRNIPECELDKPKNDQCEETCWDISDEVSIWSQKCELLSENSKKIYVSEIPQVDEYGNTTYINETTAIYQFTCDVLGYERDCDGSLGDASNPWPALCSAFQRTLPTRSPTRSPITPVDMTSGNSHTRNLSFMVLGIFFFVLIKNEFI